MVRQADVRCPKCGHGFVVRQREEVNSAVSKKTIKSIDAVQKYIYEIFYRLRNSGRL